MTVERAKEVLRKYEDKYGKIETNFFILANSKEGVWTVEQLKQIINGNKGTTNALSDFNNND